MRADAIDQKIVPVAEEVVAAMADAAGMLPVEEALSSLPGFVGAYKLDSRKGTCFEVRFAGLPPIFAKALSTEQRAENERVCSGLLSDAGINCPAVLASASNAIARRFIEGSTASAELDVILARGDCQEALNLCDKIGGMLRRVHEVQAHEDSPLALNDLTLRNFIVSSEGELCLIDLEEAGLGRPSVDIGALIVHILTHRPSFSQLSWQMAQAAFAGYCGPAGPGFSEEEWKEGQEAAIKDASSRRNNPALIELLPGILTRISEWKMPSGGGGRLTR